MSASGATPPLRFLDAIARATGPEDAFRFDRPHQMNVNLAHTVWVGCEETFPSYRGYQAMLLGIAAVSFSAAGWLARRLLPVR